MMSEYPCTFVRQITNFIDVPQQEGVPKHYRNAMI
jgi:hypothetical protein